MTPLMALLLLLGLAGCRSFLVVPTPLATGTASRPSREYRPPSRRLPPGSHEASPRPSPDSVIDARERLMASEEFVMLSDGVDDRGNPFAAESIDGAKGEAEEARARELLRWTLRAAADVTIVLVPVALCVRFGKVPPQIVDACGWAATAVLGSPIEPALGLLPWEKMNVLKWAAEGGVAILFSPLADRFVVSPAIHQWVQARLRSICS